MQIAPQPGHRQEPVSAGKAEAEPCPALNPRHYWGSWPWQLWETFLQQPLNQGKCCTCC